MWDLDESIVGHVDRRAGLLQHGGDTLQSLVAKHLEATPTSLAGEGPVAYDARSTGGADRLRAEGEVVMTGGPGLPSLEDALRDEMHAERVDCLRGPEGPEGRLLGALVGANVARERTRRGLELAALADRSAIRVDLLALLEAGRAVPSLRAIWALASALEVPFGVLLARGEGLRVTFHHQPAGRGRVIASADGRFRSRALSPTGDPHAPEVYELTLAPGCVEEARAHGPNTFEHLVVVRGTVVVRVGRETARLAPGDALFFRADGPHSYQNPGADDAVVHLVMSYT